MLTVQFETKHLFADNKPLSLSLSHSENKTNDLQQMIQSA